MKRRVIVLDEAEQELIGAEEWYEAQRPGLGREFTIAIGEAMERLAEAALAASPVVSVPESVRARRVFVRRFPYAVVFIEHDEDLWVIAFAHQHRQPGYWRERVER